MFNNLGLHTELLTPLSVVLLIVGGILGYGGKYIINLFYKKPSENAVLIVKFIGVALALAGMITIFKI